MLTILFKIIVLAALVVFAICGFIRIRPWLAGILAALGLLIELYLSGPSGDGPPPFGKPAA
jgi:hypothetical protein